VLHQRFHRLIHFDGWWPRVARKVIIVAPTAFVFWHATLELDRKDQTVGPGTRLDCQPSAVLPFIA